MGYWERQRKREVPIKSAISNYAVINYNYHNWWLCNYHSKSYFFFPLCLTSLPPPVIWLFWGWAMMMQVIRVCDEDGCVKAKVEKCVWLLWSVCEHVCIAICTNLYTACDFILTQCLLLKVNVVRELCVCVCLQGGRWWQMQGSTVPEASKLPVIFPWCKGQCTIMSSPTNNAAHWEPAQRLAGCHNNPNPALCLLE